VAQNQLQLQPMRLLLTLHDLVAGMCLEMEIMSMAFPGGQLGVGAGSGAGGLQVHLKELEEYSTL
jgi:hypothetical protein